MIHVGNALTVLKQLPKDSAQMCLTSPPYFWLRDYGHPDQLGLEEHPDQYVSNMVEVFSQVRRVLKKDGTLWVSIADTYAGGGNNKSNTKPLHSSQGRNNGAQGQVNEGKQRPIVPTGYKPKDLLGIPWLLALALQRDGWYWRQNIIWHKPNPMPESVKDRFTRGHEYLLLFSKSRKYKFETIQEPATWQRGPRNKQPDTAFLGVAQNVHKIGARPTRNKRDVWTITRDRSGVKHTATMPIKMAVDAITAGCPKGGTVIDPFFGAGTTGIAAEMIDRKWIGIELNADYAAAAATRIQKHSNKNKQERFNVP